MKTTILLLFGLCFIIYIGKPNISFNPFSFSLPWWKESLALLFLILSISFYALHHEEKGRYKAYNEVMKLIEEKKAETDAS